jgi:hypothetical protein
MTEEYGVVAVTEETILCVNLKAPRRKNLSLVVVILLQLRL